MMELCHQVVRSPAGVVVVPDHQHTEIKMVTILLEIIFDKKVKMLITYVCSYDSSIDLN